MINNQEKIFNKISEIIKSSFKETFKGGNVIIKDSSSRDVKLKKRGSLLCITLDKGNSSIIPFFVTSVQGLCKIADKMIIYPKDEKIFIFVIELKSASYNSTQTREQLRAGYELSKYICGTALRLLNYPDVEICFRGLIFSHKNLKGTTKPKTMMYKEDLKKEFQFRHLQSGNTYDLEVLCR